MAQNFNKALTLDERRIIENGIRSDATKTAIAQTIGKDNSTVGKEIKLHRYQSYKCSMPLECSAYKHCKHGRECIPECPDFVPFKCSRRDRSPGACNGCTHFSSCRFDKFLYEAGRADREYRTALIDSRQGVNLTTAQAKEMAADMKQGLDLLDQALGHSLFNQYAQVLLTDRGSEFSDADGFERRADGTRRCRVFYCDPMQSGQKGSLEVNHEQLRYILPKKCSLAGLGLVSQDALNLCMSHINSAPAESLHGKSSIEYTRFMDRGLWHRLKEFGIQEIPKDEIILKPYLLKAFPSPIRCLNFSVKFRSKMQFSNLDS